MFGQSFNPFKGRGVGYINPPSSNSATLTIAGLHDDTEEIELLTPEEWQMIQNELNKPIGESRRPWWNPACECGSEKTYGEGTNLHSSWCPRYKR